MENGRRSLDLNEFIVKAAKIFRIRQESQSPSLPDAGAPS
jgi:hypothetical protein